MKISAPSAVCLTGRSFIFNVNITLMTMIRWNMENTPKK